MSLFLLFNVKSSETMISVVVYFQVTGGKYNIKQILWFGFNKAICITIAVSLNIFNFFNVTLVI